MKTGDLEWMKKSHGNLAWHELVAMTVEGLVARARDLVRPSLRPPRMVLVPDTPIARAAEALCKEASAPYLANHCARAFHFGELLDPETTPYDDEALYVATMLHDLGLAEGYAPDDSECFTSVGAKHAGRLARDHGWSDKRAHIVAEAITLHLNVVVRASDGREAQLVRLGTAADVAGLGLRALSRETIAQIVSQHPRHSLKRHLCARLEAEAKAHPRTRSAFLVNIARINTRVRETRHFED